MIAKGEERGVKLGEIILDLPSGMHIPAEPGPVRLSLRPEILHIESMDYAGSAQCLEGEVTQSAYMGPVIEYSINTQAGELFTRGPAYDTQHRSGSRVRVRVRPEEIIVIPGNSKP